MVAYVRTLPPCSAGPLTAGKDATEAMCSPGADPKEVVG